MLGPSLLFGEPSQAKLFDKASQAEPSFFQERRAEPSFFLSKPSQTELRFSKIEYSRVSNKRRLLNKRRHVNFPQNQ